MGQWIKALAAKSVDLFDPQHPRGHGRRWIPPGCLLTSHSHGGAPLHTPQTNKPISKCKNNQTYGLRGCCLWSFFLGWRVSIKSQVGCSVEYLGKQRFVNNYLLLLELKIMVSLVFFPCSFSLEISLSFSQLSFEFARHLFRSSLSIRCSLFLFWL